MSTIIKITSTIILMLLFLSNEKEGVIHSTTERTEIILYAEEFLGTKYDRTNQKGFDCSGFVQNCYRHLDYKLPRSSRQQNHVGSHKSIDNAEPGDLIVFTGSNAHSKVAGHVGIVHHWQHDTLYFIHASSSQGVIYNHMYQPYYKKRFLGIRNIIGEESLMMKS